MCSKKKLAAQPHFQATELLDADVDQTQRGCRNVLQTVGAGVGNAARASWMNSTTSACALFTAAAVDCYACGGRQ